MWIYVHVSDSLCHTLNTTVNQLCSNNFVKCYYGRGVLKIITDHILRKNNYSKLFPDGSDGKESICNAGNLGSIPGSGRYPWRRKWLPTPVFFQWTKEPTVHGITKSQIRLSN